MAPRKDGLGPLSRRGKKIFFVGGGGGGKTTIAMLFASTALARGIIPHVYDLDKANLSMDRFFEGLMPLENRIDRDSDDPNVVQSFLEERVFSHDEDAIVDIGANLEEGFLLWLADRGRIVADDVRIICPIHKIDGASAAARIWANAESIRKILVLNPGAGPMAANARASAIYQELIAEGAQEAIFPKFDHTLARVDRQSQRPDLMLRQGGLFDRQGAKNLLREVEDFFEPLPDFRFW